VACCNHDADCSIALLGTKTGNHADGEHDMIKAVGTVCIACQPLSSGIPRECVCVCARRLRLRGAGLTLSCGTVKTGLAGLN
jgi:hypothetical protein